MQKVKIKVTIEYQGKEIVEERIINVDSKDKDIQRALIRHIGEELFRDVALITQKQVTGKNEEEIAREKYNSILESLK